MRKCLGVVAAGLLAFGSAHASPILVDPTATGSDVNAQITSSYCLRCFSDVSLSDDLNEAMAWLQPDAIDLGDGTFLGVSFEDVFEFGIGNTTTVSATVSRYGVTPIFT